MPPANEAQPWGLLPAPLAWAIGGDLERRGRWKTRIVQGLIVLNVVLGTRYIVWRALHSVNWDLWPLGLLLLAAESYSYVDALLFGMNMWRVRDRGEPPAAIQGLGVDVFITTYNEPIELVRETATAALAIRYPHATFVLDDGNRPEMRRMTEELGCGYIVRTSRWAGKDRHAKAGNLINAMYETTGEFLLILDADQVPRPQILDRVLGYFRDPNVAFVQTPQWFKNTPKGDPFGSDAPLFYGPIQAGKDGWNSGFFCGSNAVLRREALMRVGVAWYSRELEARVRNGVHAAAKLLRSTRRKLAADADPRVLRAIDDVLHVVDVAGEELRAGKPVQEVTWDFQRRVEQVSRAIVVGDLARIREQLADVPGFDGEALFADPELALRGMSTRDTSPLAAFTAVRELLTGIDMDRVHEAEAVLPMSTVSITEDMATAMRLHSLGFTSVYHHEVLAEGLAPEDLHSALTQRLRWAQGTMQVMLRENPLFQPGLTLAQRLLYFGTMWSYLSGFAALVYLGAPILFLVFGLMPVKAYSFEFFGHLLPWLIVNQLMFVIIGWGLPTWRGQQYSLALFPLWIKAVVTTIGNVYFGQKLGFVVTPKTRQHGAPGLRLVRTQLFVMAALVAAIGIGLGRLALGWTDAVGPILINVAWATYGLLMLSVVVEAATYRSPGE
jgi:cellulose synthase (UDP-forming)